MKTIANFLKRSISGKTRLQIDTHTWVIFDDNRWIVCARPPYAKKTQHVFSCDTEPKLVAWLEEYCRRNGLYLYDNSEV